MPRPQNYADKEILLALIWVMPKKLTKGQIGRLLGIKSAGQQHWRGRLERLREKNLLSVDQLDGGDLFSGSPILKYYLTEANLEAIWSQYFINHDKRHGRVNDPFLTPFSAGIWNITSSPEFSKLVGSKFNFYFLCAKNQVAPVDPQETIASASKDKTWKVMDAVLSICWKTEAYLRKPVLLDTLNPEQRKTFKMITEIFGKEKKAHPADYKRFAALFEKSFKYYV
jgi:hypothetical protein